MFLAGKKLRPRLGWRFTDPDESLIFFRHKQREAPVRPCIRTATLNGYVGLAKSVGLDPERLMGRVGLTLADLATPDKWVAAADAARLLEASAKRSATEDFGLRLAELRRLSTLGPLSVVLKEEPNLRSALQLLVRYQRSYNEALRMSLSEANDLATVQLWYEFGEPAPTRQALELAVAALYGIIRAFLGQAWRPVSVCFSHRPPADLTPHRRTFGPNLQFAHNFTGVIMYATDLDAGNQMADPLLRPYAQQLLKSIIPTQATTTTDSVRELVRFLLPLGRCSMEQVARNLGVEPRTLHRRLAQDDQSFMAIVHEARAGIAERYLTNERYTLTEVSQLLGFSAPSAFTRWFREQFNTSPSQWRRAAQLSEAGMVGEPGQPVALTTTGAQRLPL
jgi:AraC-like DNA-binding protein